MFDRSHHTSGSIRVILILIFFLNVSSCWRSFNFKIFNPIYENYGPEIFEANGTVDHSGLISFNLNAKRDLPNAFVHILVVFDGDGLGKLNLVYSNYTVDICSFLLNRKSSILLKNLFEIGEKYGVLAKRCPIKKRLYYVTNMKVVPDHFPSFVPIGNGTLTFTLMTKLPGETERKTYTKAMVSYKFERKFEQSQRNNSTL